MDKKMTFEEANEKLEQTVVYGRQKPDTSAKR